jgi:hypothetical protein
MARDYRSAWAATNHMEEGRMSKDIDARIIEYLSDFPHRTDRMEKYGVCRDWLKGVLMQERQRCLAEMWQCREELRKDLAIERGLDCEPTAERLISYMQEHSA